WSLSRGPQLHNQNEHLKCRPGMSGTNFTPAVFKKSGWLGCGIFNLSGFPHRQYYPCNSATDKFIANVEEIQPEISLFKHYSRKLSGHNETEPQPKGRLYAID